MLDQTQTDRLAVLRAKNQATLTPEEKAEIKELERIEKEK